MNGRFSIAMHIMTLLAFADEEWISSESIADSINVNPVLVRKELSNLRNQGLVTSREGKHGGSKLTKPASQIAMSDVFLATHQGAYLGSARNEPNPQCPIGRQINQHLDTLNQQVEQALVQKLGEQTLAEFCHQFKD